MENEKRLIDANALSDAVDESKHNNPHSQGMVRVNHRNEHEHFLRMIMNAPTVDAVEVVECRDCKHFEKMKSNNSFFCNEYGGVVKENDYCSRAEPLRNKKMDGGNEDG